VVLVVCARLNQFTMHFGSLLNPNANVIQIDRQEEARDKAGSFLHGDACTVLEALQGSLDRLGSRQGTSRRSVVGDVSTDRYTCRPVGEEAAPTDASTQGTSRSALISACPRTGCSSKTAVPSVSGRLNTCGFLAFAGRP
jgi:hypothetical protein